MEIFLRNSRLAFPLIFILGTWSLFHQREGRRGGKKREVKNRRAEEKREMVQGGEEGGR